MTSFGTTILKVETQTKSANNDEEVELLASVLNLNKGSSNNCLRKTNKVSLYAIVGMSAILMVASFCVGEYAFFRYSIWPPDADGWYGVINGEETMSSE